MSRHVSAIALLILLAVAALPVAAQPASELTEEQVNTLIIDRDYERAMPALARLVAANPEPDLALRLARVLLLGEQERRAIEVCREVMEAWPDSNADIKARFIAADAHAALGEFAEAEALIHEQVSHLLGPERKAELAQILIEHADTLFDPEDEDEAPNFDRARLYFEQALELGPGEDLARTIRHRIGQCWAEQGQWQRALETYRPLAEEAEGTDLHATALFELARAELNTGQRPQARYHLRRILAEHPDAEEIAESERLLPETFGGTQPPSDVMLILAVDAMSAFVDHHPDHESAEETALNIARAYQSRGRTAEAIEAVDAFLSQHPDGELTPEARVLLGELQAGAQNFGAAREAWNDFLRNHPTDPRWTEIQRRMVDLDHQEATHAFNEEDWDPARRQMSAFLERYPLDSRQAEGLHLLGRIEEEQENWEEALAIWADLADKHPNTEPARRALLRSAEIAERELGDVERARELYREARDQGAGQAAQRLSAMETPELVIETEQAFLPGETPRLHLVTRNIEALECAAYAIDLETYFRAKHTLAGVADLDIALIDPDETWEHTIQDYEEFRVFEQDLDLPLEGTGAWALRLSTEDLETTALVLVTDLAVITRSSRNQALIFAQRWGETAPADGVRVLLSDGEEVFAELETGSDGTVLFDDEEELRDLNNLRVFVTDGESVACSELDLRAVNHVEGRRPRGYLWSAKPVYQPGQTARVAGVIRVVENGRYTFADGEEWRVAVADSRGQTMMSDTVTLDSYGMLSVVCPLPQSAPLGNYTVTVSQEDGPAFQGGFRVDRYQVDQVQLIAELDRSAVVRGETVHATITARRYTGEPLRGEAIHWQMPDDIRHEGETDDSGQLEIEIATAEIGSEGPQPLQITLPSQNITVVETIFLAETNVEVSLSTIRPVYLAEEPFEVSVHTQDVEDEPIGIEANLIAVRVTSDGGEVPAAQATVSTDPDSGDGGAQITLTDGGLHRIRIEGTDAEGRPFTAQTTVTISDEDDEIRLRLLADRDTYRVGEEAELTVMNRSDGRLALATWETDRILHHEIIDLEGGRSTWRFPLTTDHSPTITAALSLVDGTDFHAAAHGLTVENDLIVSIEMDEPIVEPGSDIEVRVHAEDPAGNPVSARVALALVDRALLARYPDTAADIGDFFFGARREHTVRSCSSAGFSYDGVTRPISDALLAERRMIADRLELERHGFAPSAAPVPATMMGDLSAPMEPGAPSSWAAGAPLASRSAAFGVEEMSMVEAELGRRLDLNGDLYMSDFLYDPQDGTVSEGDVFRVRQAGRAGTAGPHAPRRHFVELGFFDPGVTTDDEGNATVSIPLPDNTTLWRLHARGTTQDTLVGEGENELTTRRDFYVSIQAPARLTEGDRLSLPVRVHNLTGEALEADLLLSFTQSNGEPLGERFSSTLQVPADGRTETQVELSLETPRDITVAVRAEAGALSDALEQTIDVEPWGIQVSDSNSGIGSGDRVIDLSLSNADSLLDPSLTIDIFPAWDDALLAAVAPQPFIGPGSVAGRALIDAAVLDYLRASGREDDPRYETRRLNLQAAVAQLLGTQDGNGGWSWVERASSDAATTSQALRALAGAQRHGVWVEPSAIDRAVSHLQSALRTMPNDDLETRADVHHALATAGRGDFTALYALHRERNRLSRTALARVTLAFDTMGRAEIAGELAALLAQGFDPSGPVIMPMRDIAPVPPLPPIDTLEGTALTVLALQRIQGQTPQVEQGIDVLMSALSARHWHSDRSMAAAASAIAEYESTTEPGAARLDIDVVVDGETVQTIEWRGDPQPVHIALAEGDFDPEGVRISLRVRGDGEFTHQAVLSAFHPGIPEVNGNTSHRWRRQIQQAEQRHNGRVIPRNVSIARHQENITNPATAVAVGGEVHVETRFDRYLGAQQGFRGQVVIEEPIPMGTQVVPESVSGGQRHEILPDRIRIYLAVDSNQGQWGTIQYRLRGTVPGEYRAMPTAVWNVANPGQVLRGNPWGLTTLRPDQPSPDTYTFNLSEHYHLGLWLAEEGDHVGAIEHLLPLFTDHELHPQYEREIAHQILESAIALNGSNALPNDQIDQSTDLLIVRFFEVLRERHPNVILTWQQTLTVAEAYRRCNEGERAWQVLRAAAGASFLRDAQVAGTLEEQGDHRAAIEHLDMLIDTYPDLEEVQSALYALAGAIELKATNDSLRAALDEEGLTIAELHDMSLQRLQRFLIDYPENPRAAEATLSLATLWLGLERHGEAIRLCESLRQRYPQSPQLDEAVYLSAYAHFLEGEDEASLALCQELASGEFPTPAGTLAPSPDRPQSHYITAMIRHAQGDPEAAIEAYRIVEQQFPDAREVIAHLTQRALSLPEVTTHPVGETAMLELTSRNLDEIHLRVYRVDLMTLTLLRRNLDEIVDIDLAGITPTLDQRYEIGAADDYVTNETEVDLGVEEPGAYLVVAAADNLLASGIVLLSDLDLEVQEDTVSGRVRANVADGAGLPVADADVRVIGRQNDAFISGETDRRGIFVADGISGVTTVLVRGGDQYAFHRGTQALQARPEQWGTSAGSFRGQLVMEGALTSNLTSANAITLSSQQAMFDTLLDNDQRGVDIYRVQQ